MPRVLGDFERDPRPFIAHVAKLAACRSAGRCAVHDQQSFTRRSSASSSRRRADEPPIVPRFPGLRLLSALAAAKNTPADVQREQVIAFYDDRAHAVHVRRPSTLGEDRRTAALALAHEIAHALQHEELTFRRCAR
jgi:hypothetical protein